MDQAKIVPGSHKTKRNDIAEGMSKLKNTPQTIQMDGTMDILMSKTILLKRAQSCNNSQRELGKVSVRGLGLELGLRRHLSKRKVR